MGNTIPFLLQETFQKQEQTVDRSKVIDKQTLKYTNRQINNQWERERRTDITIKIANKHNDIFLISEDDLWGKCYQGKTKEWINKRYIVDF